MAIGVLILGESGTGKTYSIHNFKPEEVKIISVQKPILPFRGKYDVVKADTGKKVIKELKNTDKKNIVIDDFQYILGLPMMQRIGEKGWDKFNEIQQPYADVLAELNNLPDDTIVYINSHIAFDDDGRRKIKTIGKALDKYITIEGLFMIVLGTLVQDNEYYFTTQNSGNDTCKSPEGMFPSLVVPNDLKYVEEKIRNYYYMEGAKTDEEIAEEDKEKKIDDVEPGKKKSRRKSKKAEEKPAEPEKKEPDFMEIPEGADEEEGVPFEETDVDAGEPEPAKKHRRISKGAEESKGETIEKELEEKTTDTGEMTGAKAAYEKAQKKLTEENEDQPKVRRRRRRV